MAEIVAMADRYDCDFYKGDGYFYFVERSGPGFSDPVVEGAVSALWQIPTLQEWEDILVAKLREAGYPAIPIKNMKRPTKLNRGDTENYYSYDIPNDYVSQGDYSSLDIEWVFEYRGMQEKILTIHTKPDRWILGYGGYGQGNLPSFESLGLSGVYTSKSEAQEAGNTYIDTILSNSPKGISMKRPISSPTPIKQALSRRPTKSRSGWEALFMNGPVELPNGNFTPAGTSAWEHSSSGAIIKLDTLETGKWFIKWPNGITSQPDYEDQGMAMDAVEAQADEWGKSKRKPMKRPIKQDNTSMLSQSITEMEGLVDKFFYAWQDLYNALNPLVESGDKVASNLQYLYAEIAAKFNDEYPAALQQAKQEVNSGGNLYDLSGSLRSMKNKKGMFGARLSGGWELEGLGDNGLPVFIRANGPIDGPGIIGDPTTWRIVDTQGFDLVNQTFQTPQEAASFADANNIKSKLPLKRDADADPSGATQFGSLTNIPNPPSTSTLELSAEQGSFDPTVWTADHNDGLLIYLLLSDQMICVEQLQDDGGWRYTDNSSMDTREFSFLPEALAYAEEQSFLKAIKVALTQYPMIRATYDQMKTMMIDNPDLTADQLISRTVEDEFEGTQDEAKSIQKIASLLTHSEATREIAVFEREEELNPPLISYRLNKSLFED